MVDAHAADRRAHAPRCFHERGRKRTTGVGGEGHDFTPKLGCIRVSSFHPGLRLYLDLWLGIISELRSRVPVGACAGSSGAQALRPVEDVVALLGISSVEDRRADD